MNAPLHESSINRRQIAFQTDVRARHADHSIGGLDPSHLSIPRVSVVMPTLNEAANLPLVLPRMPFWIHEVVLVDGRSTDDTVETARGLRPDVRIVMETTPGKGAALRAGFAEARGDIIVAMDADGSMNPDEIVLLVSALLAGADFSKGSRFIEGGGSKDLSAFRALGNWGLTTSVRLLYGCRFSDLCYANSDPIRPGIPISFRPPFRFEAGHRSDLKPAT